VTQHCQSTGSQLFICLASNTINKRPLTLLEQYVAAKSSSGHGGSRQGRREKNGLPDEVPLVIGLKIMVTLNVKTDLDVANSAQGTIVGISLSPDEPPFDISAPVVTLTQLLTYILVKMECTCAVALPRLEEGVLPIIPASKSYQTVMSVVQKDGQIARVT
jgi:hypothetical protein